MEHFMRYFARFLANAASLYMPFGGIYLMSTVVYACEFMISPDTEGGALNREAFCRTFVESRGAGMGKYIG
jgi:glucokinase